MPNQVEVILLGDSMWPTFCDGDSLTFEVEIDPCEVVPGDVVLASHPFKLDVKMVKRVRSINDEGRFFLVGDHPDPTSSDDSHNIGHLDTTAILGRWTGEVKRA